MLREDNSDVHGKTAYYREAGLSLCVDRHVVAEAKSLGALEDFISKNWDRLKAKGKTIEVVDNLYGSTLVAYKDGQQPYTIEARDYNGSAITLPALQKIASEEVKGDVPNLPRGSLGLSPDNVKASPSPERETARYYIRLGGANENGLDNIIGSSLSLTEAEIRIANIWDKIRNNHPIEVIDDYGRSVATFKQGLIGNADLGIAGEIIVTHEQDGSHTELFYIEPSKQRSDQQETGPSRSDTAHTFNNHNIPSNDGEER